MALLRETQLEARIIFSDGLDPDPEAATDALRKAGYQVIKMPEKFRSRLLYPRDYFLEVVKTVICDPEDCMDEAGVMLDELNEIVDRYGAMADDCGPIDLKHPPFADLFS
jgi:hypothetical protein